MGCDIHFYVERRVNNQWETADKWTPDEDEPQRKRVSYDDRLYTGRNYNLFAMLANVRNHENFIPMAEPRGLPDDASPEVQAECESWDCDGHSHSWQTVAELLAYDWTQHTNLTGWVDAYTFAEWENWGRAQGQNPKSWCGGVGGGSVKHFTEDEMRAKIAEITKGQPAWRCKDEIKATLAHAYCRCSWKQFYYQCAANLLSETMPKLWRLGAPEDVRIVYWFDN